jgi:prepilin-type N-terminal cleavage/methylation domain-containing protein
MYLSIRYNFRAARRRPAFTLIELMISIGLIVILMLGINQVFKMSSDAVGAGQTLSAMTRDSRAAATILQDDARMWVKDSPIFYIRMERDPSGLRRDYMAFFARGSYHRHTAQGGAFSSPTTSAEAYIWFGHLFAPGTNVFLPRNIVGRTCILLKDPARGGAGPGKVGV